MTKEKETSGRDSKKHKEWTSDQWKYVLWSDESKFEIFGSTRSGVSLCDAGKVNGWSLHAWFPPWSMEEEVWWCGAALLVTLLGIYSKLKAHWTSMATTASCSKHAIPFGLRLVGPSFIFQQDNDPKHTSRLCKGYLTKKESDGVLRQMTWPPQSPDLNPIECFGMRWTAEWRQRGQQVLSISRNSFKTVEKPFQMTTSWSSSSESQQCAKQ